MNWEEKKKLNKASIFKGWGSDRTAWDQPRNLKYRQAIYQEKKEFVDKNFDLAQKYITNLDRLEIVINNILKK